jgi:hypothetical protein
VRGGEKDEVRGREEDEVERRREERGVHQDRIEYKEWRHRECVRFEKADPTRRL